MRYYYEFKEKNGCKVGGHNLEDIEFYDNYIILSGLDDIPTIYGKKQHWIITLIINQLDYLKIEPMLEKEND